MQVYTRDAWCKRKLGNQAITSLPNPCRGPGWVIPEVLRVKSKLQCNPQDAGDARNMASPWRKTAGPN